VILGIHHFKVHLSDQEVFLDALASLPQRIRSEKGCILYALSQETNDPESFIILEQWQSSDDFSRFVLSDEYRRVFAAMDLCKKMPQIRFFEVHLEKGMETLNKIFQSRLSK